MKKFTKIMIIITTLLAIPNIFLARYVLEGISATGSSFAFNFSTLGIVGLVFSLLFSVSSTILYFIFLRSLKLTNMLFFSTLPLTLIFSVFLVYISTVDSMTDVTSQSVKAMLNITEGQKNTSLLWAILALICYLVLVFVVMLIACKPLRKVENITRKLGDGRSKAEEIKVGGNKQFREIETSLNKINYNYKEKDKKIKLTNLQAEKVVTKQFFKFFNKDEIRELELGNGVQKFATTLFCGLKMDVSRTLSLEESFNYVSSYLKVVAPLVKRYDGFIDKFMADGLFAVFSKADNAISCAHAILKAVSAKNKTQKNMPSLDAKISINSSDVTFKIVGDDDQKTPSIVSGEVELASKIEEINAFIGTKLLFTKGTLSALTQNFDFAYRFTGYLEHNGEKIMLFESLEYYGKKVRSCLIKLKSQFESGVRFYDEKNYLQAKECFEAVLHSFKDDKPSFVYYDRINEKLTEKN